MKLRKKLVFAVILLLLSVALHWYSGSKIRVEMGYSTHFYDFLSRGFRYIFGFLPFSFGDILYGLLVCWLVWRIGRFFRNIIKKKYSGLTKKEFYSKSLLDVFIFCAGIYLVFNISWGINYNRKGIAWQLALETKEYSTDDLKHINKILIEKINGSKDELVSGRVKYPSNMELYEKVNLAYRDAALLYPFLDYKPVSLKTSMWGWLGNYTGFTGYYNPFTGEAQLNTTVPKFLHPFIACHEVGHQLGYAKEMEANFVGYLAASRSPDPLFRYSVYLDLFVYAYRNLYITDSATAKMYKAQLSPSVMADLKEWSDFDKNHRSFVEPIIRTIYGFYLRGNQQPSGVLSYDEVTGFIIAYYKKFGRI